MRARSTKVDRSTATGVALLLATGGINLFARRLPVSVDLFLSLVASVVFVGLALGWGVSMQRRLLPGRMRNRAVGASCLMALWMLLRAYRYRIYAAGDTALLMCWYGYYVCHLGIACLLFLTCLDLWERERGRVRAVRGCVAVAAVCAGCAALANNTHQLVFVFVGGVPVDGAAYTYGPLYYMTITLIYGLVAASVLMLARLHRLPLLTPRSLGPLLALVASGVLALVISQVLDPLGLRFPFNYPELACLTLMLIWEWLVRARLIPSNTRYVELFSAMSDPLCVTDADLRRVYETGTRVRATADEMARALDGTYALDRDTLLKGEPVSAGYAFWELDISLLNRINDELAQSLEDLTDQNELLVAQNDLRHQQALIEARDELMTGTVQSFYPRLRALREKVEDLRAHGASHEELATLYVQGTYMKRAMNLRLLAVERDGLDSMELVLCLKDSVRVLSVRGVNGAVSYTGTGTFAPGVAEQLYDAYERLVECAEGLECILLHVNVCDPSIACTLEPASLAPRIRARGIACQEADGALYVCLAQGGGGV